MKLYSNILKLFQFLVTKSKIYFSFKINSLLFVIQISKYKNISKFTNLFKSIYVTKSNYFRSRNIKMKSKKFRLIVSNKNNAKINMATDEALALSYEQNDTPILRLYHWEKSFTLGIGQKVEEYSNRLEYKEYNNNYAKRITGGGVLFHGHDLSYSLILSPLDVGGLSVKESYEKICSFLLNFYKKLGLNAKYVKDDNSLTLSKSQFCQVGFEAYDIVIDGKKIGGNAQRRTKNFIFQHGSIPLEKITTYLQNKNEVGNSLPDFGVNISYEKAHDLLTKAFEETFSIDLKNTQLTQKEEAKLAQLLKEKYDI